jgi:hypothetical protein
MTQSYSLDLRVRVVAFVEAGHSCLGAWRHPAWAIAGSAKAPTARSTPTSLPALFILTRRGIRPIIAATPPYLHPTHLGSFAA